MPEHSQPLRSDIINKLLEQISVGRLQAGNRIIESRIAEEFGVSRTPVREALLHLEREGVVRSELSRGFLVNPLSRREIQETYPIIWNLEGLALSQSADRLRAVVAELRTINENFESQAEDPNAARNLDSKFHEALVSRCGNSRLLALLGHIRRIMGRYEQYYMRQPELVRVSASQHRDIVDAIDANDFEAAVLRLETNWRFGMEVLLEQLDDLLKE